MIKKSNLIICPHCQEQGKKFVLAELLPNGDLLILRGRNTIRIRGDNLQLGCDECGEVCYIREKKPMNEFTMQYHG